MRGEEAQQGRDPAIENVQSISRQLEVHGPADEQCHSMAVLLQKWEIELKAEMTYSYVCNLNNNHHFHSLESFNSTLAIISNS